MPATVQSASRAGGARKNADTRGFARAAAGPGDRWDLDGLLLERGVQCVGLRPTRPPPPFHLAGSDKNELTVNRMRDNLILFWAV